MFKRIISTAFLIGLMILLFMILLFPVAVLGAKSLAPTNLSSITPNPGAFTFTEDTTLGHLTAENDRVKVVWHYKTRGGSPDHSNRSGGNIYELYDKRTDPDATHNLVAMSDFGTGGTSPPMAGIGGLGATHMWESGSLVATSDNANFGRVVSRENYIDTEGNAVFEVSFIVRSNINDRPDNYRVDKKWEVHPNGQIKLTLNIKILRDHEIKEPAYDFSFNRDYGWTTASSIGHNWNRTICGGIGSYGPENRHNSETVINNVDTANDYDNQLLHAESFNLYGQAGGSSVRVKMDNNGGGFEGGGLFSLGATLWGTTANPTVEYSNYKTRAHGHTLRFFGWWGGAPTTPRYKLVRAGTRWTDTVWIEMLDSSNSASLQIVGGVDVNQTADDAADVAWTTNVSANSEVSYWPQGGGESRTVRSDTWEPRHVVSVTGMEPGQTYEFEVKSRDGLEEVTASGTVAMRPADATLTVSSPQAYWKSYQAYCDRLLTVNFLVTNEGRGEALTARTVLVMASSGIYALNENISLGNFGPGEIRPLEINYVLPPGLNLFRTNIFLRALDAQGRSSYFPHAPPE